MGRKCSYYLCPNKAGQKPMFSFPRNPILLLVWLRHCGNITLSHQPFKILKNKYVCMDHFDKKYIRSETGQRKRLWRFAIPRDYKESFEVLLHSPDASRSQSSPVASTSQDNSSKVIVVDPKVYIMCRLCLENTGKYQIVPTIQSMIKYCFDIEVDHFDGLPQLLCENCKKILDSYTALKKKFIEKQKSILIQIKSDEVKEEDINQDLMIPSTSKNSISPEIPEHEDKCIEEGDVDQQNQTPLKTDGRKRIRLISNSSIESQVSTKSKKKQKSRSKKGWKKNYVSYFVCNICSNRYKKRKNLFLHLYNVHSEMKTKHHLILNKIWKVNLNNFSDKINETESPNVVMFTKEKLVEHARNALYHILHISRNKCKPEEQKASPSTHINLWETSINRMNSETSDDDEPVAKKRCSTNRLNSRSSNETVLIEGYNNKSDENINPLNTSNDKNINKANEQTECINIDDSSDSDVELNASKKLHNTANAKIEYKTIENIISVCKTKYLRKIESCKPTAHSESSLIHKILNVGRKIIKKTGYNNYNFCILKYLEHKDLDILWLPKNKAGDNLVRINTRLKPKGLNETVDEFVGWMALTDKVYSETIEKPAKKKSDTVETKATSKNIEKSQLVVAGNETVGQGPFLTLQPLNGAIICTDNNREHIVSDVEAKSGGDHLKKILNETPVANPKQLPKKNQSTNDTKNGADIKPSIIVQVVQEQNECSNMLMPIITSTTSLADLTDIKKEETTTQDADKSTPRIKVKPVSELMKPELTKDHNTKENHNILWTINAPETGLNSNVSIENIFIPNMILTPVSVPTIQPLTNTPSAPDATRTSESDNNSSEPVILDTVELPNTKTFSPFQYFKMLLSLHNILLLEPNAPIRQDYTCLLKIKVHFKQENKSKVVVLCLSIFCSEKEFCICIKDINHMDIQMSKISANWQWEILKIFKGNVSNRILENAMKAGQEVYSKTTSFINLLSSINCSSS